jgi:hypothetical protein
MEYPAGLKFYSITSFYFSTGAGTAWFFSTVIKKKSGVCRNGITSRCPLLNG